MPDYLYKVTTYVDVSIVPRGLGGSGLSPSGNPTGQSAGVGYTQANVPGFGASGTPGQSGFAQTRRFEAAEMVPNAIATPPTAANIGTAISSTATDIQGQITAAILAQIQNWATGSE
jgi:hypothetical protein